MEVNEVKQKFEEYVSILNALIKLGIYEQFMLLRERV
jgi:hypothetical protein